ncbi:hypothetical protein LshimejAT787_0501050 [Lyophyllum shimeji]|uniref:Ubiquitin-like protease family profile domain-containing protein n=1 Tax=Lyophyllum shimeji TaxID=47721 RepID=A0A9P3PLR2_LYOSH|nr:hypothetical protein LshimejAT787_0501050 [Lyophyllum shimeji]
MVGFFTESDRKDVNGLHGLSLTASTPNNCRDASTPVSRWKKQPTPIATPGNGHIRQQNVGPWSRESMGSNPTRKTPNGNRTAQQTLTGGSSSLGMSGPWRPSGYGQSASGPARKKQKTGHATTSQYSEVDERGYVAGRGTPGARQDVQNRPPDGEIITVDESDEDLGVAFPGTPDPLNLSADGPSAKQLNKRKPFPAPFRTAPQHIDLDYDDQISSYNPGAAPGSRSVRDGADTIALQRRLTRRLEEEEEDDPIEEPFSTPPPTKPDDPPQGKVKSMTQLFEKSSKPPDTAPRLDLRVVQPNQRQRGIKDKMRTKNPVPQSRIRDPVATQPTNFVTSSNSTAANGQVGKRHLRIKDWFLGTERQSHERTYFITWDRPDNLQLIQEGRTQPRLSFDVRSEVLSFEYAEDGDNLVFALQTAPPRLKNYSRNTERFKMGDKHCGSIVILFDTEHKDWSIENYRTFITWIKSCVDKWEVLRGIGRWEAARALSELGDRSASRQKASNTQPTDAARAPKRTAPDDNECTPPPVDQLSTSLRDASASISRPVSRAIEGGAPTVPRRSTRRQKSPTRQRSPTLDPDEVILCYPQGVPGAVNITNADYKRLQPGEFLNDTLIEFGLKLWLRRLEESNPELASQIHVFSSFFYKKLNRKNADEGYESVRKWTSKIDLFRKKYIIIPINENFHWYLVIIYHPEHILITPPVVASPITRGRKSVSDSPESSAKPASAVTKPISTITESTSTLTNVAPLPSTTKPSSTAEPLSSAQPLPFTPSSRGLSAHPDEVQSTQSSEGEVEEAVLVDSAKLPFKASCSISVRSFSRTESRATSVMIEDPPEDKQDRMELIPDSPLTAMSVDEDIPAAPRALSPTVSDYDGAAAAAPSTHDVDMKDVPSASTSRLRLDSPFGGEGGVETGPRSAAVEPKNFYGRQSKKAQGKQKEIPNQAVIEKDNCSMTIDDEDAEEDTLATSLLEEPKTYIFTFDSLGSKHPQAIKQLSRYLKKEAQDKLGRSDTSDPIGKQAQVPVQPNFCDCGLYLLHFAEIFMTDPLKYCRIIKERVKGTMHLTRQGDWKGELTSDMRERLAIDIEQLSAEWKKDRAAKEEAKRKEAAEGSGAIEVLESSEGEVDIVETTPGLPTAPAKKGGKGKAPTKGKAMRVRG